MMQINGETILTVNHDFIMGAWVMAMISLAIYAAHTSFLLYRAAVLLRAERDKIRAHMIQAMIAAGRAPEVAP